MTMKKWRPFWSYDIEKTELWLAEMAANGDQLTHVNLKTRVFSFEKGAREIVEFQVVFDKSLNELSHRLEESGWRNFYSKGNWKFLKNAEPSISVYPVREQIVRRNRLHSNVLKVISIWYGFQLIMPITMLLVLISGEAVNFVPSPLWIVTIMYFIQVIGVIWLAIHATRKLRSFEHKFFDSAIDTEKPVGKTFSKWKLGWKYAPDLLENWLNRMAGEGNHLVRIQGARFIFQKGEPRQVAYVYDFQLKTSIHYYDIHKSEGWQLKFSSPSSIARSSLWMKAYEVGEVKPRFTYDQDEKRGHVRKVLMMSGGSLLFSLLITLYLFWIYTNAWNLFNKIIMVALIMSLVIPISGMVRSYKYAKRMKEV
jgi:hypothetical protein